VAPEGPGHLGRGALAALPPSVVLFVVTLAGGAVVTFLPVDRPAGALATTALLLYGLTGAVARWQAGVLADRMGGRLLLPAAVLAAGLGLVTAAAGLAGGGDGWVYAGAALFGVGYGGTQNLTLVTAFARAGASGTTAASAMWNAAFDSGTAVGALAPGALAAGIGLPWTYVVIAGALGLVLPTAVRATRRAVG
jgi:predicted MFS family arabinose efflux permease